MHHKITTNENAGNNVSMKDMPTSPDAEPYTITNHQSSLRPITNHTAVITVVRLISCNGKTYYLCAMRVLVGGCGGSDERMCGRGGYLTVSGSTAAVPRGFWGLLLDAS